jgi:hypothetical protein
VQQTFSEPGGEWSVEAKRYGDMTNRYLECKGTKVLRCEAMVVILRGGFMERRMSGDADRR